MSSSLTLFPAPKNAPDIPSGAVLHLRSLERRLSRHSPAISDILESLVMRLKSPDPEDRKYACQQFFRNVVARLSFTDLEPEEVKLLLGMAQDTELCLATRVEVLQAFRFDYVRLDQGREELLHDLPMIILTSGIEMRLRVEAFYSLLNAYMFESFGIRNNGMEIAEIITSMISALAARGELMPIIIDLKKINRDYTHGLHPDYVMSELNNFIWLAARFIPNTSGVAVIIAQLADAIDATDVFCQFNLPNRP